MYQIQKWGNSLGIRIPKSLAIKAGLEDGSEIDFEVEKNKIIVKRKQVQLTELLEKVNSSNIHEEISTGGVQGKEVW